MMAAFFVLLLAVCLWDYRQRRIPNMLIVLLCALGLFLRIGEQGAQGAPAYLKWCLISGMCVYPLFKLGMLGAGDGKLLAVCAGCLTGAEIVWFFFFSLLFAAFFSIVKLIKEGNGRERFSYFFDYAVSCVRAGQLRLYMEGERERVEAGICLSGPIVLSLLLHLGGIY